MSNPTAVAIEPMAEEVEGADGAQRAGEPATGPHPWPDRCPDRASLVPRLPAAGPRPTGVSRCSELELAAAARAGNDAAWQALYDRVYPKLHAYARRRLPSPAHAEDAVAETMARAVARIGTWTGEGAGLLAWMYGILRHVVVDVQRSSWRERPATDPHLHGSDPEQVDEGEPLGRLVMAEERDRLRAAFARLRPEEQVILELRVVAGLDAGEVAVLLGRGAGAVRMAQSRALAHLRRLLETDVDRRGPAHPRGGREPCAAVWASKPAVEPAGVVSSRTPR